MCRLKQQEKPSTNQDGHPVDVLIHWAHNFGKFPLRVNRLLTPIVRSEYRPQLHERFDLVTRTLK